MIIPSLKKYNSIEEIINDYFETRLQLYHKRKQHIINSLEYELVILDNKAKYIKENLDGTIDLRKKTKIQVIQMLEDKPRWHGCAFLHEYRRWDRGTNQSRRHSDGSPLEVGVAIVSWCGGPPRGPIPC